MSMGRYWAVYDVFLGNPVLVERCVTKEGAMRFVENRGQRSGSTLFIVEQLLPAGPRVVSLDDGGLAPESREPGAP